MKALFYPQIKTLPVKIPNGFSFTDIHKETMLFGASWDYAMVNGGMITRFVLRQIDDYVMDKIIAIEKEGFHAVIDTRSHMLMKGMYPAIGGWHCDNVHRGENGQPDLSKMDYRLLHYVVNLSTGKEAPISATEFITEKLELSYDPELVWRSISREIENKSQVETRRIPDGEIIEFTQPTLHRATPAIENGWRWFFRLSFREKAPENEIRRQVQVYASPELSW